MLVFESKLMTISYFKFCTQTARYLLVILSLHMKKCRVNSHVKKQPQIILIAATFPTIYFILFANATNFQKRNPH